MEGHVGVAARRGPIEDFARWWRERRLALAPNPPLVRALAVAALLSWVLSAALLLAEALSVDVPGGEEEVPLVGVVPRLLVLTAYLGLAVGAAAIACASVRPGWRFGWPTRVFIGLLGASIAGKTVEVSGLAAIYADLMIGRQILPSAIPPVVETFGWAGLASAAFVAFVPTRWARRAEPAVVAAAALPFVLAAAAWATLAIADGGGPAEVVSPATMAIQALVAITAGIGFWLAALLLWQVVAGARAARDAGIAAGRVAERWPWLLLIVVGAKLAWLSLGYLDELPNGLGGASESWARSREDGLPAWGIAVAFAAAGAVWLTIRRPRPPANVEVTRIGTGIVSGMIVCLLVAATALLGAGVLAFDAGSWSQRAFENVGNWSADRLLATQVATVYVAGIIGLALLIAGRKPAVGGFLLIFAAWSLPRAIDITVHWGAPSWTTWHAELATLDTAITLAVAVLAVAVLCGRGRQATGAALVMALIGMTALTYSGTLVSSNWAGGAFYLGLLFPAAYLFLLDSKRINEAGDEQPARLLAAVGSASVLVTIAAVQVAIGYAGPDVPNTGDVARLLLAPALVAVLVAIAITDRGGEQDDPRGSVQSQIGATE
jgi:hypothetical protein